MASQLKYNNINAPQEERTVENTEGPPDPFPAGPLPRLCACNLSAAIMLPQPPARFVMVVPPPEDEANDALAVLAPGSPRSA